MTSLFSETFVCAIDAIKPGIPKIILNQIFGYTFGLPGMDKFSPSQVLGLIAIALLLKFGVFLNMIMILSTTLNIPHQRIKGLLMD